MNHAEWPTSFPSPLIHLISPRWASLGQTRAKSWKLWPPNWPLYGSFGDNFHINSCLYIHWLVVEYTNPSEKIWVIVSWDDEIPNCFWKVIIHSCSKPPTRICLGKSYHFNPSLYRLGMMLYLLKHHDSRLHDVRSLQFAHYTIIYIVN